MPLSYLTNTFPEYIVLYKQQQFVSLITENKLLPLLQIVEELDLVHITEWYTILNSVLC